MASAGGYTLAWLLYLLGAAGCLWVVWFWTRRLQPMVWRHLLRLISATLILTPFTADPEQSYLAPAWIISVLEGIFEGVETMGRAGVPLLLALVGTVLLWLILEFCWHLVCKKRAVKARVYKAREAMLAESEAADRTLDLEAANAATRGLETSR